jgi:hypothetical protein
MEPNTTLPLSNRSLVQVDAVEQEGFVVQARDLAQVAILSAGELLAVVLDVAHRLVRPWVASVSHGGG